MDSELKGTVTASVVDLINAKLGGNYVERVEYEIRDPVLHTLTLADLIKIEKQYLRDECANAVSQTLRERHEVCQTEQAILGNVTYKVVFKTDVSASLAERASEILLEKFSADGGTELTKKGERITSAVGLYYAVALRPRPKDRSGHLGECTMTVPEGT